VICQLLGTAGRLQLGGVDLTNVTAVLGLPPTEQICSRLLSGDANADGSLDDLNGNGTPDLQELLTAIFSPSAAGGAGLVGLPGISGVSK
jgi:hypothetical protein